MKCYHYILILLLISCILLDTFRAGDSYECGVDEYDLVEAIIDSGLGVEHVDRGRLDIENRIIVTTYDVNSKFSQNIVSQLLILNRLSKNESIDLYIRTEGGWEADAFAVIDTIQSINAPVNIHAIGEVHSAGIMILASGTGKRIVYPNTILGFHTLGEDEDDLFGERYLSFWENYAKLPEGWLSRRDDEMLYFTAKEAIEYGIADVLFPERMIKPVSHSRYIPQNFAPHTE